MRTVTTRKELIQAIKDGEKEVYVKSKKLVKACQIIEKRQNKLNDFTVGVMAESTIIVLAVILAVTIISVTAILKDKGVKIKVKGEGKNPAEAKVEIF